jgi:transcription elongation GreA/GreB family factor
LSIYFVRCFLQQLVSYARKTGLMSSWLVAKSPLELAQLFSTLEGVARGGINNMGRIRLGNKVTLLDLQAKEPCSLYLVQSCEGDSRSAAVSYMSPLGSQLLGRTLGEIVEVKIFGRTERFHILGVE